MDEQEIHWHFGCPDAEMMAWMSRKSIGILDVLMQDFGSKLMGILGRFCFTANRQSNTA
jgi:hypothetical protein